MKRHGGRQAIVRAGRGPAVLPPGRILLSIGCPGRAPDVDWGRGEGDV